MTCKSFLLGLMLCNTFPGVGTTLLLFCGTESLDVESLRSLIFTGRNEVVAKVIFLHLSVILFTGGCLPQCILGYHTPQEQTPPGSRSPQEQTHPPGADTIREQTCPPGSRHTSQEQTPPGSRHPQADTPPGSRLRHTVNERPVRILLECILVGVNVANG